MMKLPASHIPTFAEFLSERQSFSPAPSPIESEASSTEHGWPSLYGSQASAGLNEDAFLGQYIHRIYCRECREQEDMAAARGSLPSASSGTGSPASQPGSPPQYQMDQLSLAEHMNANKQGKSGLLTYCTYYDNFSAT